MILILSSPDDIHATAVKAILDQKGVENRILNLAEFPMAMEIGLAFATGAESVLALRLKDRTRIDVNRVRSIWWRRPQPFGFPQTLSDPVNRAFAQQESDFAFKGMYLSANAYWVNDITRDMLASHKVWQLQTAARLGLECLASSPLAVWRQTSWPVRVAAGFAVVACDNVEPAT